MGLSGLSRPELEQLRTLLNRDQLRVPLSRAALQAAGFADKAAEVLDALGSLPGEALRQAVELVIAERDGHLAPELDLVWTGPEPPGAATRDTAVVVGSLFREARSSVLVGGYSFDHGEEILRPLHESMRDRGVRVQLFLDIPGRAPAGTAPEGYATQRIDEFLAANWRFGPPLPAIYYDPRTVDPHRFASLHAKCVVVDQSKTLITSANFTARGQERNIEVGVLVGDTGLAERLVGHWNNLIAAGLMHCYRG